MATYQLKSRTNGIIEVSGSFAPNGSSAVSSASNKGAGFSVARTGTGTFVITLSSQMQFVELVAANLHLQMATPDGSIATLVSASLGTTGTVTLTTVTSGSAADIAANANNRVHFTLKLRTSAQPS